MAKNTKRPSNTNADKARKIHEAIEQQSTRINITQKSVKDNSDGVVNALNDLTNRHYDELYDLQKSITGLDKKSDTYKQDLAAIRAQIKETSKRIKTYEELEKNLKNSANMTDKLLDSLSSSDKNLKFVVSQLEVYFKQVALAQEATGSDLGFDRSEIVDKLKSILNEKDLEKLRKNLNRIDDWVKEPLKRSGILGDITNMFAVSFFGPIGKQLADAVDLTGKVESTISKGLDGIFTKSQKTEEQQKELLDKIENAELDDKKKEQILKQMRTKERRDKEKESLRDKLFKRKLLGNQKDILENTQGKKGFLRRMLSIGTLTGALVAGIPSAFSKLGTTRLGAAVGGIFRFISPLITKILGPAAWILTAFQGGFSIGKWINDKWGDEIGDAIWWVSEKIKGIGEWWTEFKEGTIDKVLSGVEWAKEKIDKVKEALVMVLQLKDRILGWVGGKIRDVKDSVVANASEFFGSAGSAVTGGLGFAKNVLSNVGKVFAPGLSFGLDAASNLLSSGGDDVVSAIQQAASMIGVPFNFLLAMAKQESGLNPKAKAPTSSARGLFQFISSTWQSMVSKYGAKYGVGLGDIEDPLANSIMGALYVRDNAKVLESKGIPVDYTSLYAAHFLGAGGATTLLSADRGAIAADVLPKAAESNPWVFENKDKSKRTVGEVIDFLFNKVTQVANSLPGSDLNIGSGTAQGVTAPSVPSVPMQSAGMDVPDNVSVPYSAAANSSGIQMDNSGKFNIDDIPMYVDDAALMQIALGTL